MKELRDLKDLTIHDVQPKRRLNYRTENKRWLRLRRHVLPLALRMGATRLSRFPLYTSSTRQAAFSESGDLQRVEWDLNPTQSGESRDSKKAGGLVFKAHRLLYHSTLGSRVMKKKKEEETAAWSPEG